MHEVQGTYDDALIALSAQTTVFKANFILPFLLFFIYLSIAKKGLPTARKRHFGFAVQSLKQPQFVNMTL